MADALADGFLYIYRRSVVNIVVVTNAGVDIHCCCQLLLLLIVTTNRVGEILGQFQQWLLSLSSHPRLICIVVIGNTVVVATVHSVVVLLRILFLSLDVITTKLH